MKEIKNIVSALGIAAWVILLAVLMIRLPIADVFRGLSLLPLDCVLSFAFVLIGLFASVAGFFLHSRPLLLLGGIQLGLIVLAALCALLYVFTMSGDVLAFFLRFADPFVGVLCAPVWIGIALGVLCVVCPPLFLILAAKRN